MGFRCWVCGRTFDKAKSMTRLVLDNRLRRKESYEKEVTKNYMD